MTDKKITQLFVLAQGATARPQGVIHIHDCLRAGFAWSMDPHTSGFDWSARVRTTARRHAIPAMPR